MHPAVLLALALTPLLAHHAPAPSDDPAPAPAVAARAAHDVSRYNLPHDRLALQGYDPVAYFDVGGARPRRGDPELTVDHDGIVYRFATEANRKAFLAAPESFEPSYGGWCALAMSRDRRVGIDPRAFRVSRGRLFLFVDVDHLEVDGDWVDGERRHIAAADANWERFSGEAPRLPAPSAWRPYAEFNLSGPSLALEGYDPVSYHPEGGGRPRRGDARYTLRHAGVLYRFASQAHLERFTASPGRYEPAHGGWCSYAMGATGERVGVDPEAYRLVDGQLHLFYDSWLTDTRDDWDEDPVELKRKADANWARQLEQAARQ